MRESRRPLITMHGYMRDDLIVLSKGLGEHDKLDTFLHEAIHHQAYYLDESVVRIMATELADALETLDLV